ncbi:amino acid permease, partial [Pseudomonas qingdaonensis]|uniref:amino acid permease n=1 Tax=Pseudomonas qingdaonensis TaxID=2056231 RepID=UPI0035183940
AIVSFIALGVCAIFGLLPGSGVSGVSRLWDTGGFMPNGFGAVLSAMLITMFSFLGAEVVTIAAAESDEAGKHISKATNSVIWRITLFYILSIFVIISVVPWNDPQLAVVGSYQRALEIMNIPNAAFMVDLVVLVAVTSCMNSSIYIASRMMFSLAKRGDAPAFLNKTS